MDNTTYISQISYQIEKWLYNGMSLEAINEKIDILKKEGDFPSNLVFVDAYFDKSFSSSGCAFLDTNTGETIVGFAGTNLDNGFIESAKDIATDGIGLAITGIHSDSAYMKSANRFMDDLKNKGYNITQATGHSLGGALSVYVGIEHDIPLIITYNGAPLFVLPTAYLTGNAEEIKALEKKYNGQIIRFVSDKDLLNSLSDAVAGFYLGEEHMFYNGKGHDIGFFLGANEQAVIEQLIRSRKDNIRMDMTFSVDFDGDDIADLTLSNKDLITKNLLGKKGSYSGNGKTIKIDPATLLILKENLEKNMVENDLGWIQKAVNLCETKNNSIMNAKNMREDRLCNSVVEGLEEAQLSQVLSRIDDSHGKLLHHKETIDVLRSFDTYAITRKFDQWGNSGGRKWYLDGSRFDEHEVMKWISDIKDSAFTLYHQITTTGELTYKSHHSGVEQVYRYDTISEIGKAFVNITNDVVNQSKKVFKGTGLRSGKNDGIVNAISEVLEVERKNVEELRKQILSLASMAKGLANNFSQMDTWLSADIANGKISGAYDNEEMPKSYEAYLREENIFDDVLDVLEAYDIQVEKSASKLTKMIQSDYEDLIQRATVKLRSISESMDTFTDSLQNLLNNIEGSVTSTRTISTMTGYNQWNYTEKKEHHGCLKAFFPYEVVRSMNVARSVIVPAMENLEEAMQYLTIYSSKMYDIKVYMEAIIEKAVYDSMGLDTINEAQNMVSLRIKRMAKEIESVKGSIQNQYKGSALQSYQEQLGNTVKLLTYFDLMVEDSFGKNT